MSQRLKNFFSYHTNLNIPIRIISTLLLIFGVLFFISGFLLLKTPGSSYFLRTIPFVFITGITFIILSYGLSHLRKWAIYLLIIATIATFFVVKLFSIIPLFILIMTIIYYKRFEGGLMPRNKFVIIVIALVIISAVGFFAWQYLSAYKLSDVFNSVSINSEDKVIESAVSSNWITYTNQEHGFEFSTPNGSEVLAYNMLNGGVIRINLPKEEDTNLRDKYLEVIGRTLLYNCSNPANSIIYESELVYTDNIEGSILKEKGSEGAAGSAYLSESYSFENNRKCFALVFGLTSSNVGGYSESERPQEYNYEVESKVFREILSTFRFLEEQEIVENINITGWVDYRSNKYNVEFKHPNSLSIRENEEKVSFTEKGELNNLRFTLRIENKSIQDTIGNLDLEDVLIGGVQSKFSYISDLHFYYVPINDSNTLVILGSVSSYGSMSMPEQIELFKQILSTLKFIN